MKFINLGNNKIPAIAIGTWSWGSGINGGNRIFRNSYNYGIRIRSFNRKVQ